MTSVNILDAYLDRFKKMVVLITYLPGMDKIAEELCHDVNQSYGFKVVKVADVGDANLKVADLLEASRRELGMQAVKTHYGQGIFLLAQFVPYFGLTVRPSAHIHVTANSHTWQALASPGGGSSRADYDDAVKGAAENSVGKFINVRENYDITALGNIVHDYLMKTIQRGLYGPSKRDDGDSGSTTSTPVKKRWDNSDSSSISTIRLTDSDSSTTPAKKRWDSSTDSSSSIRLTDSESESESSSESESPVKHRRHNLPTIINERVSHHRTMFGFRANYTTALHKSRMRRTAKN